MNDSEKQNNEIVLSFADVKLIYRQKKKKIFWGALIGMCIAGLISLLQPIQYTSKGSFHEKGKSDSPPAPDAMTASFFKGESKERSAKAAIKSRKILESVIQKLDLQATLKKESGSSPFVEGVLGLFGNIPKNLQAEFALFLFQRRASRPSTPYAGARASTEPRKIWLPISNRASTMFLFRTRR